MRSVWRRTLPVSRPYGLCALIATAFFCCPMLFAVPTEEQVANDKKTPARQRKAQGLNTPANPPPGKPHSNSLNAGADPRPAGGVSASTPVPSAEQQISAEEILLRLKGSLEEEIENPPPVFALYFDETDSRNIQMSQSLTRSVKAQYALMKSRAAARYNRFVSEVFPGADLWVDPAGRRVSNNSRTVTLTPRRILWLLADDAGSYSGQLQTWIRQMRPPVVGAAIDAIVNVDDLLTENAGEDMETAQLLWVSSRAREAILGLVSDEVVSVDDQQALKRFLIECGVEQEGNLW